MPDVQLPRHIFRAYDIRGVLGEEVSPDCLRVIARTFARRFLGERPKVVLARDLRASSAELAAAVREGLVEAGAEVWDIGVVPTPVAYFAMGRWNATGGIIVTASHNPPEYNGMKVRVGDRPFYAESLQELYVAASDPPSPVGGGFCVQRDPYAEYFETALGYVKLLRPLRVVLDLGNGAGALTAPRVLREMGCELEVLFEEPDGGQFRGRGPDPTAKGALQELAKKVVAVRADIGFAIDADGDRLAIVDEKGHEVSRDRAVIPICRYFLEQGRNVFVADVRCTRTTIEDVELRSGKVVMAPCGYPFILRAMAEHRGVFGFENTGHYFFDNPDIKFDDATFAAAVMCQVLSSQEQTVGEIIASAPKYFTADEVRWKCDDELKFRVVEELRVQYEREYRVNATDGVRVELPDGWALVRASNTAPELTMRWEGRTEEARDRIGDELLARVREVMEQLGVG